MKNPNKVTHLAGALALGLLQLGVANATTFTWDGGTGNWSDVNWLPGPVAGPTASGDSAFIDSGTVTLTTNNQINNLGATTIATSGTLTQATDGNWWNNLNNLTMQGGTLQSASPVNGVFGCYSLSGTVTVSGGVESYFTTSGSGRFINLAQAVGGGTTFDVTDATSSLTVATPLADNQFNGSQFGAASLTKAGPGTLTLAGANTYSGPTSVNAGRLAVTTNLGSFRSSITIASGAIFEANVASGTQTVGTSYMIDGTGLLIKSGGGNWTIGADGLQVSMAMTGGQIDLQGGTLQNNYERVEWTSNKASINVASGAILDMFSDPIPLDALTGSGTVQNGYNPNGTRLLTLGNNDTQENATYGVSSNTATFSGIIGPTGTNGFGALNNIAVTKIGSGTQVLTGVNTYSGATTVSEGTLEIGGSGKLYGGGYTASPSITVASGTVLKLNGWDYDSAGSLGGLDFSRDRLVVNGGTIEYVGASNSTVGGAAGRNFTVGAGGATLKASSGSGQLWFIAANTLYGYGNLINNESLTLDGAGAGEIQKVIEGSGSVTKTGAGTWTLSGANTCDGATLISEGTLVLNNSGTAGDNGSSALASTAITVNSGATLFLYKTQFGYNNTAALNLNGGTLGMTDGQFNYIKNITLSNGAAWNLGTGFSINGLTGANFGLTTVTSQASSATSTITSRGGAISAASGLTFNVDRGTVAGPDLTVSAVLADYNGANGWLTKTGNGMLALSNYNTYTGGTTVDAGTLVLDGGSGGVARIRDALTVNSGAAVTFANDDGTGLGWSWNKVTSLTLNGGTVSSSGTIHVWNLGGGINMTGGTLQSNNGVSDPNGPQLEWNWASVTTNASADTATIGGRIRIRGEGGYGGISFNVADGATATDLLVSAAVTEATGGMGVTKSGAGTMVLSGANSYTGATTVSGGVLAVTGTSIANTGKLVIDGGTVDLTNAETVNTLFFGAVQQPSGTYSASSVPAGATITPASFSGSGTLIVGDTGFSSWITGTFANGTVTNQGPNDDDDNDGISNLVEYAIAGQDPTVPNATIGSFTGTLLSFAKRSDASGLTYAIQESTDLGASDDWDEVTGTPPVYVNDSSTISYSFTPGTPEKNFLRLQVEVVD